MSVSSLEIDKRLEQWCLHAESGLDRALATLAGQQHRAPVFSRVARAMILLRAGRGPESLAAAREAEDAARDHGDAVLELHAVLGAAKALTVIGDLPAAFARYQAGIERARATGDRYAEGLFLVNLGFYHGRLGEAEAYEEYTRLAIDRFRGFDNRRAIAHALNNLAGAVAWVGRYDEALGYYDEALALTRELDWKRGQALVLGGIGGVLLRTGRIDEGVRSYIDSIAILREVGEAFLITRHFLLLGEALRLAGFASEALPFLAEAVAHAEAGGFDVELAGALDHTSRAHEALGALADALQALRRQTEVERATGRRRGEEQLERLKLEHRLSAAKAEAEARAARNAELEALNAALTASLEKQRSMQEELERMANHDMLTGLYNRRFLTELAERERARALRAGHGIAFLLVDVDHFKAVNDAHGHAVGDAVLVGVGRRLRGLLRTADVLGRWGGEEFLIVAVDVDEAGAARAADRLCLGVSAAPFPTEAGPVPVTVSCGVALFRSADDTVAQLVRRADQALYASKAGGRDRWTMG